MNDPLVLITTRREVIGMYVDLAFGLGRSRNASSILHRNIENGMGQRNCFLVAEEDECACTEI